ncbi:MAG: type II toxin-antitoxin system RelE/ParE family toxin [Acidobacteria bacterium]|nr:type II toxin-antitoxin system RelE/ParE family toxin [Acidobacteriota bacterium]
MKPAVLSEAANRVIDEIWESMLRLNTMPKPGHLQADLASEPLRFWPVSSYLVIYRAERRPMEVVRILSGYRGIGAVLR